MLTENIVARVDDLFVCRKNWPFPEWPFRIWPPILY